ncbi:MAG: NAD(P)/FAD-dependent oxidoreductase [Maribacter sp.]
MKEHDIAIIGGGLAGLTAAIHMALEGQEVIVFEAHPYPHHKVCGEYVSREVEPYLKRLGVDLLKHNAVPISHFEISTHTGHVIKTQLPLGGIGISRYAFDDILYQRAVQLGVVFYFEKVVGVAVQGDAFEITSTSQKVKTKIAIGAYGKRSLLDKKLDRDFSFKKQSWLAVKSHYKHKNFPDALVALHNFEGGYGGLSKTEKGMVNFCYLVNYETFKSYKDIESFNTQVVSKNPYLRRFLKDATPVFDSPMSIAQISFDKKESVVKHMLMCGDTAGLIHPLCGNGMAMAIHSAKLVSELVVRFFKEPEFTRKDLEKEYTAHWKRTFARRLWVGRRLQSILMHKTMVNLGIRMVGRSNRVLTYIIGKTHGKLIE